MTELSDNNGKAVKSETAAENSECEKHGASGEQTLSGRKPIKDIRELSKDVGGVCKSDVNENVFRTLTADKGAAVTAFGDKSEYLLNGKAVMRFVSELELSGAEPWQICEKAGRYYSLDFYMLRKTATGGLRVKLTCALSDGTSTTEELIIDEREVGQWQHINIPIDVKSAGNGIASMKLCFTSLKGAPTLYAGNFFVKAGYCASYISDGENGKEYVTERVPADNNSRITRKIYFHDGNLHTKIHAVSLINGKSRESMKITDAYGRLLCETDVYGIKKIYSYDGDRLSEIKLVGTDGTQTFAPVGVHGAEISCGACDKLECKVKVSDKKRTYSVCDDDGKETVIAEVCEDDYYERKEITVHRGSSTDFVTVDMYCENKPNSIYACGKRADFEYYSGDWSMRGDLLAYVDDGFSGRQSEFFYDDELELCEWRLTDILSVKRLSRNRAVYRYADGTAYTVCAETDGSPLDARLLGISTYKEADGKKKEMPALCKRYGYDVYGRVTEIRTGEGNTVKIRYDGGGYVAERTETNKSGELLYRFKYRYDESGNLTEAEETVGNFTRRKKYVYDGFGRLTEESDGAGSRREYAYSGERLSRITENGVCRTMRYDDRGRTVRVTDGDWAAESYCYDNCGDRISDDRRSYVWDRGGLLVWAGGAEYEYDYRGMRYKKTCGNKVTEYFFDGERLLAEKSGGRLTHYFYDESGICACETDGVVYRFVKDVCGNVAVLESQGKTLARYAYDAEGNCTVFSPDGTENTNADFIGNVNPIRWKGFYFDSESGLYYAGGRYYDPFIGGFLDSGKLAAERKAQIESNGVISCGKEACGRESRARAESSQESKSVMRNDMNFVFAASGGMTGELLMSA